MRVGRRRRDGRWILVEPDGKVWRLAPLEWIPDGDGRWPWVEFEVRELGAGNVTL